MDVSVVYVDASMPGFHFEAAHRSSDAEPAGTFAISLRDGSDILTS